MGSRGRGRAPRAAAGAAPGLVGYGFTGLYTVVQGFASWQVQVYCLQRGRLLNCVSVVYLSFLSSISPVEWPMDFILA